jgi:flap endonuclease-1
MGIKHLNRYLRNNCPESIRPIRMADLQGKLIAVDISIYLYKFEADGTLLENMYTMLSIFYYYNIVPIFIFDGKPPPEKKALIKKRKENREEAQKEYNELKEQIKTVKDEDDRLEMVQTMDQLKKQIVQMNKDKIETVKNLIRAYGATYYDAPGEADELCAALVMKKKVWACLSEDMDMFVYGATRVIRYFSLINHTGILYYTKGILDELQLTHQEFKQICILSGTDYNIQANGYSMCNTFEKVLRLFRKWKTTMTIQEQEEKTFYEWVEETTDTITDLPLLLKINEMFNLSKENQTLDKFKHVRIANGPILCEEIQEIMKADGFIFIEDE